MRALSVTHNIHAFVRNTTDEQTHMLLLSLQDNGWSHTFSGEQGGEGADAQANKRERSSGTHANACAPQHMHTQMEASVMTWVNIDVYSRGTRTVSTQDANLREIDDIRQPYTWLADLPAVARAPLLSPPLEQVLVFFAQAKWQTNCPRLRAVKFGESPMLRSRLKATYCHVESRCGWAGEPKNDPSHTRRNSEMIQQNSILLFVLRLTKLQKRLLYCNLIDPKRLDVNLRGATFPGLALL